MGLGQTSEAATLALDVGSIDTYNKLTVLRPQDRVLGYAYIKGDLEYNSNANGATTGAAFIFRGVGTQRITRSASVPPMDTSNVHIGMECAACTTEIDFLWKSNGCLYLDSGTIKPTRGYAITGSGGVAPNGFDRNVIQVKKGHYIGTPMTGNFGGIKLRYIGEYRNGWPTISTGGEWPSTGQFGLLEVYNVNSLSTGNLRAISVIKLVNSYVLLPSDSMYIQSSENLSGVRHMDTMRLGSVSARIVKDYNNGPISLGGEDNFRFFQMFLINQGDRKSRVEYFGQPPGSLGAGTVAPLTKLIGRNYIRITPEPGTGTQSDSAVLRFFRYRKDSLKIPRWDQIICQAPHPTGPWKAIGTRDSLYANRSFQDAKMTFADGQYFAWGSLEQPYDINLIRVDWPPYYKVGCVSSVGLPLRYIFQNNGTTPLDTLEFGFQTDLEFRSTKVALRKPLPPLKTDTVIIEGPTGPSLTVSQNYTTKAWITHPGFNSRQNDSSYQRLFATPAPMPWAESFDTIIDRGPIYAYRSINRLPLLHGWEFDYGQKGNYYYFDTGTLIQFYGRNNFHVVTIPVNVSPGRVYVGHKIRSDVDIVPPDTIRLEATTDCGATWISLRKYTGRQIYNNGFVLTIDSINIINQGTMAIRVRKVATNGNASSKVELDYLSISSLPLSLPTSLNQPPTQYWYPNPTTGLIKFTGKAEQLVSVFNMMGHLVLQRKIQPDQSIDLSAQPPGLYLIKGSEGTSRVVRE